MQAITHFFSGIFISILLEPLGITWLRLLLITGLCVLAHFLIDALAKITYHPPDAKWDDAFWVSWHAIVYVGSVACAIIFIRSFFFGMLVSVIPDIYDWGIIRGVRAYKRKHDPAVEQDQEKKQFMEGWEFHVLVDKFRERFLSFLPDLNHEAVGILPEIAIWIICILGVVFIG